LKQLFSFLYKTIFPIFFLCLFLTSQTHSLFAFDFSDLYEEVLSFDENGDLIMSTYDSTATAPVTYRTIGWTIKRKNLPIDDPDNTCVTIPVTNAGSQPDPNNPYNQFHYFYTSRTILLTRIGEVSQEWLQAIISEGEIVYLDAVMTVCHSGVPQGRLYHNGSLSEGEVYYTLEGILNARNWGTQSQLSLKTHFGKSVFCQIPVPPIHSELEHQYFHYNEFGICPEFSGSIFSGEFDVRDGIPTSEELSVNGIATPFGYHLAMELVTGVRFYTVPVTVTYHLTWVDEEGNSQTETETISYAYTLKRSYSYRQIKELQLSYAEKMDFSNALLPDSCVSVPSDYYPNLIAHLSDKESDHLIDPVIPSLSLNGGTIDGGSSRPSVLQEDFTKEAEAALGEITVKNDFLSIDGQVILSDQEELQTAPKATYPSEPDPLFFADSPFSISNSFANGTYPSFATVFYQELSIPDAASHSTPCTCDINSVTVHTPVLCDASISDSRHLNQQVTPDLTKPSLILGENFTVSISCMGTHRPIKGYGMRDYEKYALDRQVCFPFPVEKEGISYKENTWISMEDTTVFTLPVEVEEGNYTIRYRTLSQNALAVEEASRLEADYANLNLSEYLAVDFIDVAVMGRLFDFHITDIHDYPRWEGIFSVPEAVIYHTDGYYIGMWDKNGLPRQIHEIFTLPVVPGSNPLNPLGRTLYLGYSYRFSITTIGNFYDSDSYLEILCSYDYINKKTGIRFPVDLYYTETVNGKYSHLMPFQTSFLLDSSKRTLSEKSQAIQTWTSQEKLPYHLYAVPYGTTLPLSGIKQDYWLSDGYIVVNYHIYACKKKEQYLDYWNLKNAENGCCNMWQMEGYKEHKTGSDGLNYPLLEGDVIFYDLEHNLSEDYWYFGTH